MTRLFCGTGNPGKLREFRAIAQALSAGVTIDLLPGFENIPAPVEDGATFGENAIIKARHYSAHINAPVFADDSGLMVESLDGAPGVYSARYSGPGATDESNNRLLLENLRDVSDRTARFVCLIALVERGRVLGVYSGSVEGTILEAPRGSGGFGYDPLFYYPPLDCTFGEASEEQKTAVSHRGLALRNMLRALPGLGLH